MDSTATTAELDVLTEEELAAVVGGADLRRFDAQEFVYNKTGMCGCGLAH